MSSCQKDMVLVKNSLAYIFLSRGIPVLYYGTEQQMEGKISENRKPLWLEGYDTDAQLYKVEKSSL